MGLDRSDAVSERAGRREWIALAVLALPTILSAMDFGVLSLAPPHMFRDDRRRSTAINLWATSLLVGVVLGPLVGGALLQRFW